MDPAFLYQFHAKESSGKGERKPAPVVVGRLRPHRKASADHEKPARAHCVRRGGLRANLVGRASRAERLARSGQERLQMAKMGE